MAVERKVVRVTVRDSENFEQDLQDALDAKIGVGDWSIVLMERSENIRTKVSYLVILERTV